MKEVALHDAKNRMSALIAEIESSGEDIIITRHGKPAARLSPVLPLDDREARAALVSQVIARREQRARDQPQSTTPLDWEMLKRESDEDRR